jgi:hypothetical protein
MQTAFCCPVESEHHANPRQQTLACLCAVPLRSLWLGASRFSRGSWLLWLKLWKWKLRLHARAMQSWCHLYAMSPVFLRDSLCLLPRRQIYNMPAFRTAQVFSEGRGGNRESRKQLIGRNMHQELCLRTRTLQFSHWLWRKCHLSRRYIGGNLQSRFDEYLYWYLYWHRPQESNNNRLPKRSLQFWRQLCHWHRTMRNDQCSRAMLRKLY